MVKKRNCLTLMSLGILLSTNVNAEQVKFSLPDSRPFCDDGQLSTIHSTNSRETVFVTSHLIFPQYYVYDVEMKCTLKVFATCPPDWIEYKDILKSAQKGDLLNSTIRRTYYDKGTVDGCIAKLTPVTSQLSSDYQQWKDAKIKADKEREKADKERDDANAMERKLNGKVIMPYPKYSDGDSVIGVNFDGHNLQIENKTTDFVNITSISTYLNDKINTMYNLKKELPPESIDKKILKASDLFTGDMDKSFVFIYKEKDIVGAGVTKFGFAIKYSINGIEKRYYSTKQYKNSDLLLSNPGLSEWLGM